MQTYCKQNLQEIKNLISVLAPKEYVFESGLLTRTTIGQHIRHILEFYVCLIKGSKHGLVNYDQRERNLSLETDQEYATHLIDAICIDLVELNYKASMQLVGNFSTSDIENAVLETSFKRELAYCLEHSIHHQALIKIALIEQNLDHLINERFGVAPPTIRYKENLELWKTGN